LGSSFNGVGIKEGRTNVSNSSLNAESGKISSVGEKLKIPAMAKGRIAKLDDSIFSGAPEISRTKLEYKMRTDSKVWQAERAAGLRMSPVERSKLVKEVFSSALGRNISKTDMKWGVKKLNQKLSGAKTSTEHEKIRKEIKFFKKLGGIK
jgi:hypothetical protein